MAVDLVNRQHHKAAYQLVPGQIIGNWRVLKPIAKGGMGEVHQVQHVKLGHLFGALKVVLARMSQDERAVKRFLQEADSLARIQHANVIRYFEGGYTETGQPYLVTEYVEGMTIAELLEKHGRMEVADALDTCAEVADGVHAAHEMGILHRDLKPANVVLTRAGQVKVLDFGIAKPFAGKALEAKIAPTTAANMVIGTFTHLAPEQLLGEKEHIGRWTDVFSLGVMAYQMLAGMIPWADPDGTVPNFEGVAARIVLLDAPPLTSRFEGFPEDVWAVVRMALLKAPKDRFQTMSLLADRFRRSRAGYLASRGMPQGPLGRLVESAGQEPPKRGGTQRALQSPLQRMQEEMRPVPPAPPKPSKVEQAAALAADSEKTEVNERPPNFTQARAVAPAKGVPARIDRESGGLRAWVSSWWHPIHYFIFGGALLLLAIVAMKLVFHLDFRPPAPSVSAPSKEPANLPDTARTVAVSSPSVPGPITPSAGPSSAPSGTLPSAEAPPSLATLPMPHRSPPVPKPMSPHPVQNTW